jgi:O-antigen/teichoic acid export membrane protein
VWNAAQLIRSIFALGAAQLITMVASAAAAVLLPRYLGEEGLGRLAFAVGVTTLLAVFADPGITVFVSKTLARGGAAAQGVLGNGIGMRIPLGLAVSALALLIATVGERGSAVSLVLLCCVAVFIEGFGGILYGALQGLQRMRWIAISLITGKVTFVAVALTLAMAGFGPNGVAVGMIVSVALAAGMNALGLRGAVSLVPRFDLTRWKRIVRGGLPFYVWQASVTVYGGIDVVILGFLAGDVVLGWYAAAYRIVLIPAFVPTIVMTAIFPALTAAAGHRVQFFKLAQRAVHGVLLLSLPMALGVFVLADQIVAMLGYPPGFANSVLPMRLLALHIPLAAVDTLIGTALNASDRQRPWAIAAVTAAVLNPAANLVAIPLSQQLMGNGAVGAAVVTTITELFMLVAGLLLLPRGIFDGPTVRRIVRIALAGVAMTVVLLAFQGTSVPLLVVLGAVAYGLACLALGAVSIDELRDVWRHAARRGSRPAVPARATGA